MQTSNRVVLGAALSVFSLVAGAQESPTTPDSRPDFGQVEPEAVLTLAVDPSSPRVVYAGTSGAGLIKSFDSGNSWGSIAPELSGLGVPAVAVHPGTSMVVYAGTRGQGIWLSTTAGANFEDVSLGLPSAFIRDLVIDPSYPRVLYAATSEGLARSTSAGRQWHAIAELGPVSDLEIGGLMATEECQPTTASGLRRGPCREVWAVAGQKIWRSVFAGRTFQPMLDLLRMEELTVQSRSQLGRDVSRFEIEEQSEDEDDEQASSRIEREESLVVKVAASESRFVFVGSSRLGLFRSADGGTSWRHLPALEVGVLSLAINPLDARRILVGTERGLFQSRDGGRSFLAIEQGSELPIETLTIDPRRPDFVYAGIPGGRLLIRRDDGSWSLVGVRDGQLTTGDEDSYSRSRDRLDRLPARPLGEAYLGPQTNVLVHQIEADRRFTHVLYAATSRGVYRSGDAGETWSPRTQGLGEMPVQSVAVEPADSYARRPSEQALLLAATRGAGVYRSELSGRSWQPSSRGLDDPDVMAIVIDRYDSELVLAGTASTGIFRSEDSGRSWRAASEGLIDFAIRDLVAGNRELYAATVAGGVYRSPDLGRSWEPLGRVGLESPKNAWLDLWAFGIDAWRLDVRSLAVDPQNDRRLLAATAFGLMGSEDGGQTWSWAGRFMNATDVAFDPRSSQDAVAATSRGVARSADGGRTWRREQSLRLEDRDEAAILAVKVLEAAEAQGAVVAGTDDGRLLIKKDPREKAQSIGLPVAVALVDTRLEAQGYTKEADLPKEDALRLDRDRFLARLASSSFDELLMEDVRLQALLALEAWLRGEDEFEEFPGADLERSLRAVVAHWAALQRDFVRETGLSHLEIDPSGRFVAATYHWDDGREQRSELRVFELGNVLLYGEDALERLGPSRFWKELHEPARRPEQMPPTWSAPGAGRWLGWDRVGGSIATGDSPKTLTLWRPGPISGLASASPAGMIPRQVKGFSSSVAAVAFAPAGRHLGAIDRDGRPYFVRLTDSSHARPLAKEPPEGGARFLAALDGGVLTFSDSGHVRFWPLASGAGVVGSGGSGVGNLEPELLRQENDPFAHVTSSPTGEWILAALEGGKKALPERWAEILLIPSVLGRPGEPTVIGGGAYWSRARFSPDGRWLAISRQDGTEIWQLEREPRRFATVDAGGPVRFSPDSKVAQVGDEIFKLDGPGSAFETARRGTDRGLTQPMSFFDRRELWGLFDLERQHHRARLWSRPELIGFDPTEHQVVRASVDGRWLVATGATWQLHLWHFGDEALGALAPQTGESLISWRRVHLETSGPSAASSWPESDVQELAGKSGRDLFYGVCRVVGRSLTKPEWRRFFGAEPHRRTCARDP